MRSDADPNVFYGSFNSLLWATKPGTYYWQAHATVVNSTTYTLDTLESPVFTIVVAPPPAPAPVVVTPATPMPTAPPAPTFAPEKPYRMTTQDAAFDTTLILAKRNPTGGHLKRACTRLSSVSFTCKVSWRDARSAYAGILRITDRGQGTQFVRSTFVGLRATLSCLAKHSAKVCAKSLRW